ncbi:MAG TPA: NADH-dependent [FeFe] hydrogenase, group A6 [Candidatus Methylomirabilis sp.]|nr:NADH-dependent [FeFe] hydrogenase, group A6 [Candidatus Methylomirabilis sp.]
MNTIEVNGRAIEAIPGEMLLSSLRRAGIQVPTLCYLENLTPTGACRLCVVEVEGQRTLVPSCAFPVAAGMKVKTHSPRAVAARKTIVELLLANHPDDCNYCVRNGECQLQMLAGELGVRERLYAGQRSDAKLDISSPSLIRDPAKCILCGRCVRVCEEVQAVAAIDFIGRGSRTRVGTAFDLGLNVSSCITCGQCITVCPTGALSEQSHIERVLHALNDPETVVAVQHAPSISVTLAEAVGLKPAVDVTGTLTAALRRLGFDWVFDTSFAADLTIMEEASELVARIRQGGRLPMMTSCSPGWIKYVEQFYPDSIPNLSTCKSPQQMLGAVIKSHFAERAHLDPAKIFSVSIMPCTAKKFEASRGEMLRNGLADVDAVLTTRELAQLIRMHGIDIQTLAPESGDSPFGERSTAGKLFGATGGVAEAAIRTAHFLLTGGELPELKVQAVRGLKGIKEARLRLGELEVGVAVVSGLGNAKRLLGQIRGGRRDLHFIEVMTCPGGCIAGGGQPIGTNLEAVRARMQTLYTIDRDGAVRVSHRNPSIQRLYREFLGEPMGRKSHDLLHTTYSRREVLV